jgi:hypothetical protein
LKYIYYVLSVKHRLKKTNIINTIILDKIPSRHGGQLIVLLDELDLLIVVTAYPFWLEHNNKSWNHEKAIIKLAGKFIHSLSRG